MGHHKQTMKNESGEPVQLISLWEQLQAAVRTFADNRFVYVCECVFFFSCIFSVQVAEQIENGNT